MNKLCLHNIKYKGYGLDKNVIAETTKICAQRRQITEELQQKRLKHFYPNNHETTTSGRKRHPRSVNLQTGNLRFLNSMSSHHCLLAIYLQIFGISVTISRFPNVRTNVLFPKLHLATSARCSFQEI